MKIYWMDITELSPDQEQQILFLDGFPTAEKERIFKLRQKSDRLLSALGFLLIQQAGVPLKNMLRTVYNKPYTLDSSLKFSISHSGNIVLAACSETDELGIDVEVKNEINLEDFHYIMRPDELKHIQNTDQFYALWTAKEAIIKAIGLGFQQEVKEITLQNERCTIHGKMWHLKTIPLSPSYQCTLASENILHTVETLKLKAENLKIKPMSLTN